MKVKIMQRSVYHKYAEVEVDIPDNIKLEDVQQYLVTKEDLYVDKMDYRISHARYKFGFGLGDGMDEMDNTSEWRYEVTDQNYGGHL